MPFRGPFLIIGAYFAWLTVPYYIKMHELYSWYQTLSQTYIKANQDRADFIINI